MYIYYIPTYIHFIFASWSSGNNTNLKNQINLTMFNKGKRSSLDILSINLKAFGLRDQIVWKDRKIKQDKVLIWYERRHKVQCWPEDMWPSVTGMDWMVCSSDTGGNSAFTEIFTSSCKNSFLPFWLHITDAAAECRRVRPHHVTLEDKEDAGVNDRSLTLLCRSVVQLSSWCHDRRQRW